MNFIAGLFAFFLVVNCLVLILLILVQLPKKDAGAGLAFGSGAADALFGAGSGNALTKITKWATVLFLLLALLLGYVQNSAHNQNNADAFTKKVEEKQMQGSSLISPPTQAPASTAPAAPPGSPSTTIPSAISGAASAPPASSPPATIPAAVSGAATASNNAAK